MSSGIFARKVTILYKNGQRVDYTHVTELDVFNPLPRRNVEEPFLKIEGETDDIDGTRINIRNKFPIKDLQMTIIDWYIPSE